MSLLSLLTALGGTAAIAYLVTPFTIPLALRVGAIDIPGPRKIHSRPIGRLGGLAVLAACGACYTLAFTTGWPISLKPMSALFWGLGIGLPPIVIVSLVDDIKGVPAVGKFAVHVVGALIAVYWGVELQPVVHFLGQRIDLGVAVVPLSVLWIVGVTNAFNIIDGLDGLSAGLALISSASMAGIYFISGHTEMAFISVVLAVALGGFLPFNLYPARVFLGDTGATAIGFAVACFALKGSTTLAAGFAVMLPVVLIGIPIIDTLLAVVRRGAKRFLRGQAANVFLGDSEHIHHRLLALGVHHRKAVLTLYGVALLFAGLSLLAVFMSALEAGLLLTAIVVGTFVGISRLGYEELAFIRRGSVLRIYEIPILKSGLFAVLVDVVFVAVSAYGSIGLKFDDWGLVHFRPQFVAMTSVLALCNLATFWMFGLYKGAWRFAGVHEFVNASMAVIVSSTVGLLAFGLQNDYDSRASMFGIYALSQLCLVNGSRASYRILKDQQESSTKNGIPTLIYGAGDRGAGILRELRANDRLGLQPVGFIDDDKSLTRTEVNGVTVLGDVDALARVIRRTGARVLVLSSTNIGPDRVLSATRTCEGFGVKIVRAEVRLESIPLSGADQPAVV